MAQDVRCASAGRSDSCFAHAAPDEHGDGDVRGKPLKRRDQPDEQRFATDSQPIVLQIRSQCCADLMSQRQPRLLSSFSCQVNPAFFPIDISQT